MIDRTKSISFLLVAFFALIFISCSKKDNKKEQGGNSDRKSSAPVDGFVLQPRRLANEIRTTGTIMAFEEVELHPEATGRVIKIAFTEGGKVNKGDLLLKIYDEDLQAQLRKIESQIKLTQEQVDRQQQLLKISATSQQEFDIVFNQLGSLKADREVITSAISKTEIRAPFKGYVGLRYVNEGSYVTPASRIATVQNIDPVKIDFSIPEKYSSTVAKGDEVVFTNDETEQQFKGKVYAVEPRIDLATRTLQVRAMSENSSGKILPGSFVKVQLNLKETPDALLIPTQALMPVLKGQNVYIAKNGLAKVVPVKTGIRTEKEIQITEGLHAGDTVLTRGIISLKPDMPVQVTVK